MPIKGRCDVPDSPGTSTNAHTLSYNGLGNGNDLGHYQEAGCLQQAIALDPGFVHAHGALASMYRRLGERPPPARGGAGATPMAQDTAYNRACFASICGDVDEALALLEAAIAERPALRRQAQDNAYFDFIRDDVVFFGRWWATETIQPEASVIKARNTMSTNWDQYQEAKLGHDRPAD